MKKLITLFLLFLFCKAGSYAQSVNKGTNTPDSTWSFKLYSRSFKNGGLIPDLFSCNGKNNSPPLNWRNVPPGTKTLLLTCEDKDTVAGKSVHWFVYNIPVSMDTLQQNVDFSLPQFSAIRILENDFGNQRYDGPCLAKGTHHYRFRLIALSASIPEPYPENLRKKISDYAFRHTIAQTELTGIYTVK